MGAPIPLKTYETLLRVLALVFLLILLGTVGATYFVFKQVRAAQEQLQALSRQVEESRKASSRLQALRLQLHETQQEIHRLEQGVSPAHYVPTLLKQMEEMARQVQLKIIAVRPMAKPKPVGANQKESGASKEQEQPKPYDEQLIQVSVKGRFWNLMSFLKQLNFFPKVLAVQRMQITSKLEPGQQVNPELEVQMEVKAFIFRPTRDAVGQEVRTP